MLVIHESDDPCFYASLNSRSKEEFDARKIIQEKRIEKARKFEKKLSVFGDFGWHLKLLRGDDFYLVGFVQFFQVIAVPSGTYIDTPMFFHEDSLKDGVLICDVVKVSTDISVQNMSVYIKLRPYELITSRVFYGESSIEKAATFTAPHMTSNKYQQDKPNLSLALKLALLTFPYRHATMSVECHRPKPRPTIE